MLLDKIITKKAKIGVIGLGYVGLPLVIEFVRAGFDTVGFDTDTQKIKLLLDGKGYIKHVDTSILNDKAFSFLPTNDFSLLAERDCIIICVPTPIDRYREPDMSYVFNTTETISHYLRKGQLVVLESTTYPGATDEEIRVILEKSRLRAGDDFYLAYSPEREDPNNRQFKNTHIPKIVGGYTGECLKNAQLLYSAVFKEVVPVSSTKTAEASKLLENIYRAVNIALVNEMKMLFERMGIDIWEVIEAAKTKPFGFQAFYPGPGLGGHCIPVDPFYLTWKAREYDFSTRFIELAGEINTQMPYYVMHKTIEALNKIGISVNDARLLVLGLAYKKDVDDTRESPAFKLIKLFQDRGAKIDYNDPFIPKMPKTRKYDFKKHSVLLSPETIALYDCVIIITDHTRYDENIDMIADNARLIIDTRNLLGRHNKRNDRTVMA